MMNWYNIGKIYYYRCLRQKEGTILLDWSSPIYMGWFPWAKRGISHRSWWFFPNNPFRYRHRAIVRNWIAMGSNLSHPWLPFFRPGGRVDQLRCWAHFLSCLGQVYWGENSRFLCLGWCCIRSARPWNYYQSRSRDRKARIDGLTCRSWVSQPRIVPSSFSWLTHRSRGRTDRIYTAFLGTCQVN